MDQSRDAIDTKHQSQIEFERLDTAALWYAETKDGGLSASMQLDFSIWLEDPLNQAAWEKILQVEQRFQRLNHQNPQNTTQVLERSYQLEATTDRRTLVKSALLLVGGAGMACASWKTRWPLALYADVQNGHAAVKPIQLSSNLNATLGTQAAIKMGDNPLAHSLTLLQGQISLQQGGSSIPQVTELRLKDLRLRLIGNAHVSAEHSIGSEDQDIRITLLSGTAELTHLADQPLKPHETLTLDKRGKLLKRQEASPTDTAWLDNRLQSTNMPLHRWTNILSFYRKGHVHCHPDIQSLRITGAFPTDNTDLALTMLERSLPIKVNTLTPWWVSIHPA
jgi:transmembrane sensor